MKRLKYLIYTAFDWVRYYLTKIFIHRTSGNLRDYVGLRYTDDK